MRELLKSSLPSDHVMNTIFPPLSTTGATANPLDFITLIRGDGFRGRNYSIDCASILQRCYLPSNSFFWLHFLLVSSGLRVKQPFVAPNIYGCISFSPKEMSFECQDDKRSIT